MLKNVSFMSLLVAAVPPKRDASGAHELLS